MEAKREAKPLSASAVERQQGGKPILVATCPVCHVQVSAPKDNSAPYCHGCGAVLQLVEG